MSHVVVMPSLGMYTADGTLVRWLVPQQAQVKAGEAIAEVETDKATTELVAGADGVLHQVAEVGTLLAVEATVAYILDAGELPPTRASQREARTPDAQAQTGATDAGDGRLEVRASPMARRLALELGIDLADVTGTGPGGRIVEADVRAKRPNG